jgi:hypothetical protein
VVLVPRAESDASFPSLTQVKRVQVQEAVQEVLAKKVREASTQHLVEQEAASVSLAHSEWAV